MSDVAQVLFQSGYATPLMLARWRAKGAVKPLSPNVKLTDQGVATPEFQAIWEKAFPSRRNLPDEALHDADGKPTVHFIRVWH
jgi:hypothetical protein